MPDFGFNPSGKYNFDFTFPESLFQAEFMVLLATQSEYKDIQSKAEDIEDPCDHELSKRNHTIVPTQQLNTISDTVDEQIVYYPFFITCQRGHSDYIKANLEYYNEGNRLDFRKVPCLTTRPVMLGLFGVLAIAYGLLMLYHKRPMISLNGALLLLYAFFILFILFDYILLQRHTKTDDDIMIIVIFDCFEVLLFSYAVTNIIIFSRVLGTMNYKLKLKDILWGLIPSLVFFSIYQIQSQLDIGKYIILSIFIEVAMGLVLIYKLYTTTEESFENIKSHISLISKGGIEAKSQPVSLKYKLLKLFMIATVGLLGLAIVLIVVFHFFFEPFWVSEAIIYSITFVLCLVYAILFRPRGSDLDKVIFGDKKEETGLEARLNMEDSDEGVEKMRIREVKWTPDMMMPQKETKSEFEQNMERLQGIV